MTSGVRGATPSLGFNFKQRLKRFSQAHRKFMKYVDPAFCTVFSLMRVNPKWCYGMYVDEEGICQSQSINGISLLY